MFYSFRGLGALPSFPPPVAGMQWVRYTNNAEATSQWTSCPPNPPYGCKMYGGYAWGQRAARTGDEFNYVYIAPTSLTYGGGVAPTVSQTLATMSDACLVDYQRWAAANQDQAKCLSREGRQKIIDLCMASKQGQISLADYVARRSALVKQACAVDACAADVRQVLATTPRLAACLTDADKNKIRYWCVKWQKGEITQARYLRDVQALISTRCPTEIVPSDSMIAPSPGGGGGGTPDGGGAPTPGDVLPVPDGGAVHDEGGGGGGGASQPSLLRQLGPVVGIGLLIALGLTIASQRKKKRRRAR